VPPELVEDEQRLCATALPMSSRWALHGLGVGLRHDECDTGTASHHHLHRLQLRKKTFLAKRSEIVAPG
jgi:hypothetical protein